MQMYFIKSERKGAKSRRDARKESNRRSSFGPWRTLASLRSILGFLLPALLARSWLRGAGSEEQGSESGDGEGHRERLLVGGDVLRVDTAQVSLAAPSVVLAVAVELLFPSSSEGYSDPIVVVDPRTEIVDGENRFRLGVAFPEKRENALPVVLAVHPLESRRRGVAHVEGGVVAVEAIQAAQPALHALMVGIAGDEPLELEIVRPLASNAELASHEQELLPGPAPHVAVEEPHVRELLPLVARHLREERALSVNHLVVREGKSEVLGEGVHRPEGDLLLVELPVLGGFLEVGESVVHESHVPLHPESQPPDVRGVRHHGPCRRLLGNRLDPGVSFVCHFVEAPEELGRLQVLAAAETVGLPPAFLSRIVEVEHRGDRVHTERVGMIAIEPEGGAREKEARDLAPAVVELETVPVGMDALSRVGVLVEVGPVEKAEPVGVRGKVRGHPVEDDSDTRAMEAVDQVHEVLRLAVSGGGREKSRDLVSPGRVVRMLHGGKKLDVGEAHVEDVANEFFRLLTIREESALGGLLPRAEMDFVNGPRGGKPIHAPALLHPFGIAPVEGEIPDDRGALGRLLPEEGEGVGLVDVVSLAGRETRGDPILVSCALTHVGDEAFPYAAPFRQSQRGGGWAPAVEVPHHRNARGVGRPNAEEASRPSRVGTEVRPQAFVETGVGSLAEEIDVLVREARHELR